MRLQFLVVSSRETPTIACNPVGFRVCQGAATMLPCSVDVQRIAILEFDMRLLMREPSGVNPVHGIWSLPPLYLLIHLVWRGTARAATPTASSAPSRPSYAAGDLANKVTECGTARATEEGTCSPASPCPKWHCDRCSRSSAETQSATSGRSRIEAKARSSGRECSGGCR